MTWLSLHGELIELSVKLRDEGCASWSEISPLLAVVDEQFLELDTRHRPAVLRAIRAFARGAKIPPLSTVQRFLFRLRLEAASGLLLVLHAGLGEGILPAPQQPRSTVLQWLLIDGWESAGLTSILGTCECLRDAWPGDSSGRN